MQGTQSFTMWPRNRNRIQLCSSRRRGLWWFGYLFPDLLTTQPKRLISAYSRLISMQTFIKKIIMHATFDFLDFIITTGQHGVWQVREVVFAASLCHLHFPGFLWTTVFYPLLLVVLPDTCYSVSFLALSLFCREWDPGCRHSPSLTHLVSGYEKYQMWKKTSAIVQQS